MKKIILYCFMISSIQLHALDLKEMSSKLVLVQSVEEANGILQKNESIWPKINSSDPEQILMAHAVLKKLVALEQEQKTATPDQSLKISQIYFDLAKFFKSKGGYYNYLISDCFNRLRIIHLGKYLLSNPDKFDFIKNEINRSDELVLSKEEIINLLKEEGFESANESDFISKNGPFRDGMRIALKKPKDYINPLIVPYEQYGTKFLFEKKSVAGLLGRIADTHSYCTYNLMGLAIYLKKDGMIEKLYNQNDMDYFDQIMGEDADLCRSVYLGKTSIFPPHLLSIYHSIIGSSYGFIQPVYEN